jgi:hypothetical protein
VIRPADARLATPLSVRAPVRAAAASLLLALPYAPALKLRLLHFLTSIVQVDRKQVPSDWSRKLQAIQARAAAAARELPPGFLGQLEGELLPCAGRPVGAPTPPAGNRKAVDCGAGPALRQHTLRHGAPLLLLLSLTTVHKLALQSTIPPIAACPQARRRRRAAGLLPGAAGPGAAGGDCGEGAAGLLQGRRRRVGEAGQGLQAQP